MAEQYLYDLYYSPESPASFGGVEAVYRVVKNDGKFQISRNKIREWLKQQDTYTLHKPVRHRFKRNKVIVGAVDEEWEADLVIMDSLSKKNNGYKYILTVIDVLSKYAWAEPIKTKSGENLVKAFEKICKKGRQPEKLHTDKGTEFTNRLFQRFLKDKNILFFTTHNDTKASIVERFNRTLKGKMWKYFTAKNTLKYIDVLQKLMYSYNHSRHRSIGMKPADVNPKTKASYGRNYTAMNPASLLNISLTWAIKSESVKKDERLRKVTYPVGPKRYSLLRNVYLEDPQCIR